MQLIKDKIRTIENYPQSGIMFKDITTLLKDPIAFRFVIDHLMKRYQHCDVDYIVGIEARGFILGSALAYALGKGFIPIRKQGKLPAKVISQEYQLEYGHNVIELHHDAISPGDKVIIIDDLLATGGTILAAASLIEKLHGEVVECTFLVNLPNLGGEQRLLEKYNVYFLIEFKD